MTDGEHLGALDGPMGTITVRVVVLPRREKDRKSTDSPEILDLGADEVLAEAGASPMASYMETSKGGRQCCVFLVNGQRQDAMDNTFIVQQLGFKYLRNRMMIVVDVDGLAPQALARLMLGSRQGFYRGDVWDSIVRRVVATLKNDPELLKLEEEAEAQVSELRAGDEKVRHTLDQLIDSHHEHGLHFAEGAGTQGTDGPAANLGVRTVVRDGVVTLLPPEAGAPADYPVLRFQQQTARLRPNEERRVDLTAVPSNAWPALAELVVSVDPALPDLRVNEERTTTGDKLRLLFREPANFDAEEYPIRVAIVATARFNGVKELRQESLKVLVKPDVPPPEPALSDPPTWLKVTSRQPVRIKTGEADTHIRLRWDGKDELATGVSPHWSFHARILDSQVREPLMHFSAPSGGRLTLLVSPRPEWLPGAKFSIEVAATSVDGQRLSTSFAAEVVEPQPRPSPEPKLTENEVAVGSSRRPPYELRYVNRDKYESGNCWGGVDWTDGDAGAFLDPTERTPLVLLVNEDMTTLSEYRKFLTGKFTESELERRINKYTSHVAFHLYQMYQATQAKPAAEGPDADQARREEIGRVANTLIRLMEVSR